MLARILDCEQQHIAEGDTVYFKARKINTTVFKDDFGDLRFKAKLLGIPGYYSFRVDAYAHALVVVKKGRSNARH